MGLSLWHLIVILFIVLILFGKGKIAPLMKEFGLGIKNFKDGLNEAEEAPKTQKKPSKKSSKKSK